ncbi:uncharacterized protein LOC111255560 [Varroa destructor]|uniref:Uncharacterized protein n=1 Tax=Varroa destructor TaxID=109461 RepID=A0A7M7L807_VARDE|nr:uncharacterized protein LOC111255560 [Varroa destructor]
MDAASVPHNWQEILKRPPNFNFKISHPSLDPIQILNEVKLRNPTTDQVTIAVLYKTALSQKKNFYLVNLQRARSSAEAYQRQMKQVPKVIMDQFEENESAVRILDSLVPKLEEAIQEAKKAMAIARKNAEIAQNAGTSRTPVVEINETMDDDDDVQVIGESSSASGRRAKGSSSGPIIEEIVD